MKTLLLSIAISVAISATRFCPTEIVTSDLNTAMAPVFKSKFYFDESAKKALTEQKEKIKLKLLRAEARYKDQRPDNQLVQSIAQAHLLLTEGKDIEELNQAYNWLLIGKKITNNKLYNSMILSQLNLIFNNIDTKQ